MKLKTLLRFEDPTIEKVFSKMDSTREQRCTVRVAYKQARLMGMSKDEARLIGVGASFAFGFWTGEEF